MSIIEDSANLSPLGKILCTLAFCLGCVTLFMGASQLGKLPEAYRTYRAEKTADSALQKRPEELRSVFGGMPPKNEAERTSRELALRNRLQEVAYAMGTENPNPPKLLIAAVTAGYIHPFEAKNLLEEISGLQKL